MCNDAKAIETFYRDVLGLEGLFRGEEGYVSLQAGTEVIFFQWDTPTMPVLAEWAWQPGYKGGAGSAASFSFSYDDEAAFREVVKRVEKAKITTFQPTPEWRRDSYWGHTVRDPMGNTLELYHVPAAKPDSLTWR